jgi:phosphatidylserine decarboxylase
MYQEQFLLKSKWIVMLFIIILLLLVKIKNKKIVIRLRIIAIIVFLSVLYTLFIINQQPQIPSFKDGCIIAPSSGYIGDIKKHSDGRMTIMFNLSFFSNHVQYIPYPGKIISDKYYQSKYLRPTRMFTIYPTLFPNYEKSIEDNEQFQTDLLTTIGIIKITRIAGLVAPRVFSYINENDIVKQGDVMGLIVFSSMVLMELPAGIDLKIKKGDHAIAGETIIGVYH